MKTDPYERIARELVGTRHGKLTVTEYVGKHRINPSRVAHMVKCRCDCGRDVIYTATALKCDHVTMCDSCSPHQHSKPKKQETLCWHCKKATNYHLCRWSMGKPRDDWEAETITIREQNTTNNKVYTREVETYRVISCPAFEEG